MVGIEDERLMLMLRYFSICFHIPLSNRDGPTNGYFICGFSSLPTASEVVQNIKLVHHANVSV